MDGELILCPSTSPENTYLEKGKKMTTAMTMQILRNVFECHIKAGKNLHLNVQEYEALHSRIKCSFLNKDGDLNEWYASKEEWEPEHRHLSHLYGLFSGTQFNAEKKEAARRVLNSREIMAPAGAWHGRSIFGRGWAMESGPRSCWTGSCSL